MSVSQISNKVDLFPVQVTTLEQDAAAAVPGTSSKIFSENYAELLATTFPAGSDCRGQVVAFIAPHAKAGVSYVADSVAKQVAAAYDFKTLLISAAALEMLRRESIETVRETIRTPSLQQKLSIVDVKDIPGQEKLRQSRPKRSIEEIMALLRVDFRFVVVDAPAVAASDLGLLYAAAVDSVVVVAESGKTAKNALAISCRRIANAKGRIAGIVCNKRRYVIPQWLYRFV